MKNKLLLLTLLFTTWLTKAQVNVISSGGLTTFNTYTTLKAAFDSINGGYQTGSIQINITGNTTETATAKLDSSGRVNAWGTSFYSNIHITPVGGAWTISGAITAGNPLIDLNGADSVTFDGTDHLSGDSLIIINTTASTTAGTCTIRLINDASQNVLKNLVIKGAPTSTTLTSNQGVVYFATAASGGNGNDNNLIQGCFITNSNTANSSFPYKLIFLNGTTTNANIANSGNSINGNYLVNFRASGVYSSTGVRDLNITNNHFFHTATLASSSAVFTPIWVSNGTASIGENFSISGNYIGGTAPFCGGTQQVIPLSSVFQVIYLHCATTATSYIHNNTIANMDISSSSSTANHSYIFLNGGKIACGSLGGNTIGSMTDTANLIFRYSNASQTNYAMIASAGATSSPVFDTVWIENNTIGGISFRQLSTAGASLRVFDPTGSTATWMIRYNTIGSPTVPHSIRFNGSGNNMFGILNRSTGINTNYFVGNTYSNLTNNNTASSAITAMDLGGGNPALATPTYSSWIADSNIVQFITNNSPNTNIASAAVTGIRFKPGSAQAIRLSGNIVRNLYATHATAATAVIGIDMGPYPVGTNNTLAGNKVYNLVANTTGVATIIGLRMTANPAGQITTVYNNMISLGKDSLGNDLTKGHTFFGAQLTRGNINFYHNSILITGFNTDTSNTYAFYGVDTGGTYTVINNVFSNERSHASVYTTRNYAAQFNGTITSGAIPNLAGVDYNIYWAPNGAGALISNAGTEYNALPLWRSVAYGYDFNSINGSPMFVSNTELRGGTGSAIIPGSPMVGITNDIDNNPRNNYLMGAYDYDQAHPLPVKYLSFTGNAKNMDAVLMWSTASELNNNGFDIERSIDGNRFDPVGFVKGNGTSAHTHTYTFTDRAILDKHRTVYYRLRQVDFDGTFAYSNSVIVSGKIQPSVYSTFYPNPFDRDLYLTIQTQTAATGTVDLVDITGKIVFSQTFAAEKGNTSFVFNNLPELDRGVYVAQVKINGEIHVYKLIRH